jgi:hypothetical protein
MKNICIYCSSSDNIDEIFFNTAREMAKKIAQKNFKVVFGAGCVGLMGEIARTMHHNGGKIIGVIPEKLIKMGICYDNCDELIITADMRERKHTMEKISDGFIALPGGFGTLEEISEMITGKQLGFHNRPLVFLNINEFYTPLFEFFEHIYRYNFAKEESKKLYHITENIDDAVDYIENYTALTISSK